MGLQKLEELETHSRRRRHRRTADGHALQVFEELVADELAFEGLVRFIDNPKHLRSKLVQLTPKGHARYRELNARLLSIASSIGAALSAADIRKTTEVVRHLSGDVKARAERRPRDRDA